MGASPYRVARAAAGAVGTRGDPQRRQYRQSEREDDLKRGLSGYDGGKLVTGRKRHLLVDSEGLVLKAVVSRASVPDREGAELLIEAIRAFGPRLPRLVKIWVDSAYAGLVEWAREAMGWDVEVVKRPDGSKGFVLVARRWVVERTFAWLGRFRRLCKDYEFRVESSEGFIYLAMSVLMLRRLADHTADAPA